MPEPTPHLGPCTAQPCNADAVAYVIRTLGPSARLTVVTGVRAEALTDADPEHTAIVCAEHAHDALTDLFADEPKRYGTDYHLAPAIPLDPVALGMAGRGTSKRPGIDEEPDHA